LKIIKDSLISSTLILIYFSFICLIENFSEQTTWYKYNETTLVCNPPSTYITFDGLKIEFELGPNESVHFSFTTRAHTEVISGWSRITVYFKVEGIMEFDPSAEVGTYNGAFTINFMIYLQDVRDDLSPGLHSVTVVIIGTTTANYIFKSSLFVKSFLHNFKNYLFFSKNPNNLDVII
jgi:hypothetical protein